MSKWLGFELTVWYSLGLALGLIISVMAAVHHAKIISLSTR
ncbi:MAG: hypothetical protein RLZZ215_2491 [Pseudomonadota bacterium]|jgi:hypothetical protein